MVIHANIAAIKLRKRKFSKHLPSFDTKSESLPQEPPVNDDKALKKIVALHFSTSVDADCREIR